ncbi:MAG: alpha/beta hydrolase family protein, partial [Myxococcales bacterium]
PPRVISAENDPWGRKLESDGLVESALHNGAPVEYVVFDDEGHGFRKKENRVRASEAYLRFLEAHLAGAAK